MKRIALSLVLVSVMVGTAVANSKVLILKADGRADAKVRAKVDTAVVKLAKTGPDVVTPGEITFADAAAMVGCRAEEAACAHEVATTLGVDEVVIVMVTPKPPGNEVLVNVRRAGKGAPKDATATVAVDKVDKLDVLAPVFGGKAPAPAPTFEPPGGTPTKPIGPEPPPAITVKPPVTEPVKPEAKVETKPEPTPDLTPMTSNDPTKPTVEPLKTDQQPKDRRRLYIAGMGTGGAMVFLGIILWSSASGVQGQIDEAPTRTRGDLVRLQDLENKADGLAGAGNFFAVTGLIVAGASTYFYFKNERAKKQRSKTALLPTLFPGGAGVTLHIGGTP